MADRLQSLGLDVDCWTIDMAALAAHPSFSMEVPRTSGLGVVGAFGDGEGRTLIFNGHVDVVPIGDAAQWTVDPWQATIRDGRVFGRGACDMKGGLAAALAALRRIVRDRPRRCAAAIALHSVVAEEDGGAGTLATLVRGHRGDGAISMEPTELRLAPAHAGALSFRIRVPGRSAHGCVREEGVSAIETFRPLHDALLALEAERNARLRQPLFERYRLPFALSIGKISAGDWPSSVPDLLVCEGRYGIAPGEDAGRGAGARSSRPSPTAAQRIRFLPTIRPRVEWWGGQFMPAQTPDDAAIVGATRDAISDVDRQPPVVEAMTYGADMRLLVNDGGIPTVLFGPGDVRHAHRPDESVPIDDLLTVARTLALVAMRFCGRASDKHREIGEIRRESEKAFRSSDSSISRSPDLPVPDLPTCLLPPKQLERNDERNASPAGQDRDLAGDGGQRRAFVDDRAQRVDERGQRQRLNERLHGVGKVARREEHARQDPHRQHDEIQQARHRFDRPRAAAHEQREPAERQRADERDRREREDRSAHRDAKRDPAEANRAPRSRAPETPAG